MNDEFFQLTDEELLDIVRGRRDTASWKRFPFYPLTSPEMPAAGPSFVAAAHELVDTDADDEAIADEIAVRYLAATYVAGLSLSVKYKGMQHAVSVIPGHFWGRAEYGPYWPERDVAIPKVMILSKIPGSDEAAAMRNFVGKSGNLLADTLSKFGVSNEWMSSWYVCNVCRWSHVVPSGGTLPAAWVKDCSVLLHQDLRIFQPDYILCVGGDAAKALFGRHAKLSRMLGDIHEFTYSTSFMGEPSAHKSAKVVVCRHSADVLRSTERLPQFEFSIHQFVDLIHGVERGASSVTPIVLQKERDLDDVVSRILSKQGLKVIAVDAEWEGKFPGNAGSYVRTVQFTDMEDRGYVVPIRDTKGEPSFFPSTDAAVRQLNRLLDRDDVQIVGHFFSADLPWLRHIGVDICDRFRVPDSVGDLNGGSYAGGFDTSLAAHAHEETAEFKLEMLASNVCGAIRWDAELKRWADAAKRSDEEFDGYGTCPDEILYPYGACDVAYTLSLRNKYADSGDRTGLLSSDRFGNSCWLPYWSSMRAFPAFLEMHMEGILVDLDRVDDLTDLYVGVRDRLLAEFRAKINWPTFNHRSSQQCVELLFGEKYSTKIVDGKRVRVRPPGAKSFNLTPIKTTGKPAKEWHKVEADGETDNYSPSTDKETCGILATQEEDIGMLRDLRFIDQILKSVLRPPDVDEDGNVIMVNGNRSYSGGTPSFICSDGRLHTFLSQHKDTGRASSSRPPLQNISKRREADYARIAGDNYKWPIRSFLTSNIDSGEVLVESDYAGAELFMLAVLAQDKTMIDHCLRSAYPEDHPDYYDIHSNVAVKAFKLSCEPTKSGLEKIGKIALRVAAKATIFGVNYGRGPSALARQIREEGTEITSSEVEQLIDGLFTTYSRVPILQDQLRKRVYNPGWICDAFGRYRRCIPSDDRMVMSELERQFMNFPMQAGVASALSRALDYLESDPRKERLGYKIVLQIHDAGLFSVPICSLEEFCEEVLPECMVDRVVFKACDCNGVPISGSDDYRFQIDTSVHIRWGEKLTDQDCKDYSIPMRYAKVFTS